MKCFADMGKDTACWCLTEKLCETKGKCPFFKTKEQVEQEEQAAKERLRKLTGINWRKYHAK